jgi:tetratricopeptide (TPR) repeat protein
VQLENYKQAESYLAKALQLDKKGRTYIQLGKAYIGMEAYEKAEKIFRDALRLNQNEVDAYKGLALSAFKQKNYKVTESILMEALKIAPRDAEIWAKLGEVYFVQNQYPKSVQAYEKSYDIMPTKQIKYNLAGSLLAANRLDQSEAMYENLIKEDPKYAEAYEGLADVYIARKNYAKAKQELETLLSQFPDYKYKERVTDKIKKIEKVMR